MSTSARIWMRVFFILFCSADVSFSFPSWHTLRSDVVDSHFFFNKVIPFHQLTNIQTLLEAICFTTSTNMISWHAYTPTAPDCHDNIPHRKSKRIMTPGSDTKRRRSGFSSRVRPSSLSPYSLSSSSSRRAPRSLRLAAAYATASLLALLDHRRHIGLRVAHAYITSGLPPHTQRAFLRRLTDDICNTDPGTLTPMEVSNAPALMSAWANEVDRRGEVKGGGRERAMAVEGLLKRMIDERRAGNADAIARTEDYNAVMKSWATSGERSAAALRVEQVSFLFERRFRRSCGR